MLQIHMRPHRLRRYLLCLLLGIASIPARAGDPLAFGLIVGYRAGADELSAEHTERGPWADRRQREQAAWKRATQRSREKTQAVAKSVGLPVRSVGEAGRAALMRLDKPLRGHALDDAMRRLRLHPDVAWVEPDVIERRRSEPTETDYTNLQWHLRVPGAGEQSAMNMPPAWQINTGSNVVVAVVDNGVRFSHPDLVGKLLSGHDFVSELSVANDSDGRDADPSDPGDWVSAGDLGTTIFDACDVADSSWHGTFIAGQIGAVWNNGIGIAGINRLARILPVRVAGKCGALLSDLLDGVRWAAGLPVDGAPSNPTPARVINLSFGGSTACNAAYQSMVDDVTNQGALLVVAAGNNEGPLTRPADCDGVMAVAAVRRDGAKADYSSFGPRVALSAPGGSSESGDANMIYATDNDGLTTPGADGYGYKQGTSFSAPQAAGVASLMLSVNNQLRPADLIYRMTEAARRRGHVPSALPDCGPAGAGPCRCTATTCGAGLLDAGVSLQLASGPAAIIKRIGTVQPGARITLDGGASFALGMATIVSHEWTRESGPAVAIGGDTSAVANLQLPDLEARWVFRLTVTDSDGEKGSDTVTVVTVRPTTSGGGGGALGWAWGAGLWAWVVALAWRQRRR
jgi:serine protease